MIRKNKASLSYLQNPTNRSPSKQAHSFGKAERFIEKKRFSPDKFYELPDSLNKRSAGFGFGNKIDIVLKQMNEPAKYFLQSEFGEGESINTLNNKYENKSLKKNNSYVMLRHQGETNFNNRQSCQKKQQKRYEYIFPNEQNKLKISQKERIKSYNDNSENIKQRKTASQLKYQCTQRNIHHKSKTSCSFLSIKDTQFLLHKSKERSTRQKTIEDANVSVNQPYLDNKVYQRESPQKAYKVERNRVKQDLNSKVGPGPGSYNIFSQFGNKLRYI